MTLRCEMTEGEAILVGVAAGIALIGTIKEHNVLFLLFIISFRFATSCRWINESLTFATSEIFFHCSKEGSTPVGLCAQAWNKKTDRFGAA